MKLPVLKALATTAAFTLNNWVTLLRIVWAPYLVMFGLTVAFQSYVQSNVSAFMGGDLSYEQTMALNAQIGLLNLGLSVSTGLLGLMMTAGILRFVIHGERPKLPFYIRWNNEEWLLLGTVIVTFAAVWLFTFLVGIAMIPAAGFIASTPALAWIIPIFVGLVLLFLTVRLYLAFPAAIGRGEFGVGPAWSVSSGQFFRLLAYLLIWGVLGVLFSIIALAVVVPDVLAAFYDAFTWGPEWISSLDLNMRIMESVDATTPLGIARIGGLWLFNLVSTVVGAIAMGVAWRMVDEKPERPKAGEAGSASSVMGF